MIANNGESYIFYQIGGSKDEVTDDGNKYQLVNCIDSDGEEYEFSLFDNGYLMIYCNEWFFAFHNNEPKTY